MTAGHVGGDSMVVTTGFTMNARPLEGKVTWGERRLSLSLSLCRTMRARLTAHVQSAGIKPQSHLFPPPWRCELQPVSHTAKHRTCYPVQSDLLTRITERLYGRPCGSCEQVVVAGRRPSSQFSHQLRPHISQREAVTQGKVLSACRCA